MSKVVTFAKDYPYPVPGKGAVRKSTVVYKAGMTKSIPQPHYEAALAAGVLVEKEATSADSRKAD